VFSVNDNTVQSTTFQTAYHAIAREKNKKNRLPAVVISCCLRLTTLALDLS
jgi:hypothetical protein